MDIWEQARRMAEELPAVELANCPDHEGHEQECYIRGRADGFEAGIDHIHQHFQKGGFSFEEWYARHTEGQVAT